MCLVRLWYHCGANKVFVCTNTFYAVRPPFLHRFKPSVLASFVRCGSHSSTFCEGLLFGASANRLIQAIASDTSTGDETNSKAYKPIVSVCRSQCTGTSQTFYNSEGDIDPEYLLAKEKQLGLDIVGWFIFRQNNNQFSVSTRQIIVTKSLARFLENKSVGHSRKPIVAIMSSTTTSENNSTNGLNFTYQMLDHTLSTISGIKLECADRQVATTTGSLISGPMHLGKCVDSTPIFASAQNTCNQLTELGSSIMSNIPLERYALEEKKLSNLVATLAELRRHNMLSSDTE